MKIMLCETAFNDGVVHRWWKKGLHFGMTVSLLLAVLIPTRGMAQQMVMCVDQFYASPASQHCQMLDMAVLEVEVRCKVVAMCVSGGRNGALERIYELTLPAALMSEIIYNNGILLERTGRD
ncbi:hypothetical protein ACB035_10420 [Aeromonas sp. S12(2024)]|uniref:hypothetical protein n=1 Tax=Aeromonas sp. S12(2024) TaxID=3242885 RepID=UPI003528A036